MKKLRVTLWSGWVDYSCENPDGPPTYLRDESECPGPLQVSLAQHVGGKEPRPTGEDLVRMATQLGQHQDFGELVESSAGPCKVGTYGTAVFRSAECPHSQIWYLSNGLDFVLVTHICPEPPDPREIDEAREIAMAIQIADKPWWRFW